MSHFERVKYYFEKRWAGVDQVRKYVQFNMITGADFEEITGEVY